MQTNIVIQENLRNAILENFRAFELHYLPKINLHDGTITGGSALLRWYPYGQTVPPSLFIPQAEAGGLMRHLDWWVIHECCLFGEILHHEHSAFMLSVNTPADMLMDDDFIQGVQQIALQSGFDITSLDFEVMESVLMSDPQRMALIIRSLHRLGAQVTLDNFGSGLFSIQNLQQLKVDRVKIDRSVTAKIDKSAADNASIKALISVARHLGICVCVEGVEEDYQYEFLKQAGCDEVQGHYFAEAMPKDEFLEFVN